MEVSLWRSRERISELQALIPELRVQLQRTLSLLAALPEELKSVEAQQALAPGAPPTADCETTEIVFALQVEQVLDQAYEVETALKELKKQLEARLCIARQALLLAGRGAASLSEDHRTALAEEETLHRTHRLDDYQTWVAWLKDHESLLRYQLKQRGRPKEERERNKARLAKTEAELKRMKGLSPDQYWLDREAFGQNPGDF